MQYFKNTELAKLYHVSEAGVRKWIEASKQGKIDLMLHEHNGRLHVANTSKNIALVEALVEKGKKYKNTRGRKVVTPRPEFYDLYSEKQIFDIISNIEIYHEIPSQYRYFDGGAEHWDKYTLKAWEDDSSSLLTNTIGLLQSNLSSIDGLIEGYEHVNVIDLGAGNCLPVKDFLAHLAYDRGVLGRYIAIDISETMLDIAERNIKNWFGNDVPFERHERDFSFERFDDLLVKELLGKQKDSTLNIVLLFGGTIANFRYPDDILRTIRSSMGKNDLLIVPRKLDSDRARRDFDFNTESTSVKLNQLDELVLDLLDVTSELYDGELVFDKVNHAREKRARLKVDLTIEFKFSHGVRYVELFKDDTILLWRAWHHTDIDIINQFNRNGFAIYQASATKRRDYLLTISKINSASR